MPRIGAKSYERRIVEKQDIKHGPNRLEDLVHQCGGTGWCHQEEGCKKKVMCQNVIEEDNGGKRISKTWT